MFDLPPPHRSPDELDQRIIEALRIRPRLAVKELAAELDASEPTITSRIRAMDADGLMRICAQRDFRAAGFEVLANVDLGVRGRPLADVAREVAEIDGVAAVTVVMGDRPLMLLVIAHDLAELYRIASTQLALVEGVSSVDTLIIAEVMKYRSEFAVLAPRSSV